MLKNDKNREMMDRILAKQAARRGPEELKLDEHGKVHSNEWNLRSGATTLKGKSTHRGVNP